MSLNHGHVVLAGEAADLLRDRHLVEAAYFGQDEFADPGSEIGMAAS